MPGILLPPSGGDKRGGECDIDRIVQIISTHNPTPAYEKNHSKKSCVCQGKSSGLLQSLFKFFDGP